MKLDEDVKKGVYRFPMAYLAEPPIVYTGNNTRIQEGPPI